MLTCSSFHLKTLCFCLHVRANAWVCMCICVCHYQLSVLQAIKFYNKFYCVKRDRALLTYIVPFVNREYRIMLCGWTQFAELRRKTLTFFCYTFIAVVLTWCHFSWYNSLKTVIMGFIENLYSPYGHLHQYQTKKGLSNCQIQGHYFIWQLSSMLMQTISQDVRHCNPYQFFNLPRIRAHAFLCHVLWLILHF
jgi:hypothetical protein